jgi:hypothetical protein
MWQLTLGADRDYYTHGWWDYVADDEKRGIYRLTEHGWWDVRTAFFNFNVHNMTANYMYLPVPEYTEAEVRRIIENAWAIKKGEQHETRPHASTE